MSQEEAIKILKEINVVDFYNTYTDSTTDFSEPRKYCDAIEGILDLYNKEKEKNKKINEYIRNEMEIVDNPTICGDEEDTLMELPISLILYNDDLRKLLDILEE